MPSVTKGPMFSIKLKFILTAAVIVAATCITLGTWVWLEEKNHLYRELEGEGKLLLSTLKGPIINAILYEEIGVVEDVGLLDNFVEEIVGNKQVPIIYAFITDNGGKVLAHSEYRKFGTLCNDPLTLTALADGTYVKRVVRADTALGPFLDLAMPLRVSEKGWGVLRIAISLNPLEDHLASMKMRVLLFSGVFFFLGTGAFYIVGLKMSRPLQNLARAMTQVNHDFLDAAPIPKVRNDEIGQLQESFLEMLQRLKQSERERQQAVNQMIQNEKLATIGKLVAGVAHEVNNPLAAISTCIYNIERKLPPEFDKSIGTLKSGMSRIETIVRQLVDFSRVSELDLQPVQTGAIFREASGFAQMAIKRRPNITFVNTDTCPPMTIVVDKAKLHQVILNLIINAADASPEGGTIEYLAYCSDGFYCSAIRDYGTGIDPVDQDKIFELFYTTKGAGEGSGIGLAVCKSIVELHTGEILFKSNNGETTFIVKIPFHGGGTDGRA